MTQSQTSVPKLIATCNTTGPKRPTVSNKRRTWQTSATKSQLPKGPRNEGLTWWDHNGTGQTERFAIKTWNWNGLPTMWRVKRRRRRTCLWQADDSQPSSAGVLGWWLKWVTNLGSRIQFSEAFPNHFPIIDLDGKTAVWVRWGG